MASSCKSRWLSTPLRNTFCSSPMDYMLTMRIRHQFCKTFTKLSFHWNNLPNCIDDLSPPKRCRRHLWLANEKTLTCLNRYLDVKTFQIVKEQPIWKANPKLALRIGVNTRVVCFTIFFTARRRLAKHIVRYVSQPTTPLWRKWWSLAGSNRRPSACKADALPAELRPHYSIA